MATASGGEGGSRFRFLPTDSDFPVLTKHHQKRKTNEEITYIDRSTGFKITKVEFAEYFTVCCAAENSNFNKISPFYVELALNTHVGIGTDTKRLRDGTLLIKAKNDAQAKKIASLTKLGEIAVISKEHDTLNTSQGIIFHYDTLSLTEDELLKGLQTQGERVTKVTKIKKRVDGKLVDTPNCILTFKLSYVPSSIKFGYHKLQVKVYIPSPMKCVNCFKYGHPKKYCKNNKACSSCSDDFHGDQCSQIERCQGCGGEHNNFNKDCPRFKREYEIQKIRVMDKLSYFDAKQKLNIMYPESPNVLYSQTVRSNPNNFNANTNIIYRKDKNLQIENTQGNTDKSDQSEMKSTQPNASSSNKFSKLSLKKPVMTTTTSTSNNIPLTIPVNTTSTSTSNITPLPTQISNDHFDKRNNTNTSVRSSSPPSLNNSTNNNNKSYAHAHPTKPSSPNSSKARSNTNLSNSQPTSLSTESFEAHKASNVFQIEVADPINSTPLTILSQMDQT